MSPKQSQSNPRKSHEIGSHLGEVQSFITLRSGKQITQPTPPLLREREVGMDAKGSEKEEDPENEQHKEISKDQPRKSERVIIKEGDYA